MKQTFNPCDECDYSYSKNNQDSGMCKICEFKNALKLEKRLQAVYGKCDGLLEKVVEHLELHEGVDLPEPVFKARLLTDGEVDRWEKFKRLEKQGKLLKLPLTVGDTVYANHAMQGWYLKKKDRPYEAKVVFIGINGTDNFMNVDFGNGHMLQLRFLDIGKTVFLTKEEAEATLEELEDKNA